MLDKERLYIKIDELKDYMDEIRQVKPVNLESYKKIEKKRSCERILQLCVECTLDICKIIVSGLRLGVPSEENDLFDKLNRQNIIDNQMLDKLKNIRGFRNILVHEYGDVDDEVVFEIIQKDLNDFCEFISQITAYINKPQNS